MDNGTYKYDLEMSTPLGRRRGNLELMIWGDFLNGYLTMFTRTIPIRSGKRNGNKITFDGDMKTLMNVIAYHAEGSVTQSGVNMVISTQQGEYPVTGVLTEARRS